MTSTNDLIDPEHQLHENLDKTKVLSALYQCNHILSIKDLIPQIRKPVHKVFVQFRNYLRIIEGIPLEISKFDNTYTTVSSIDNDLK